MNAAGLSHIGSNSFASAVFWFVFFSLGLERWGGARGVRGGAGLGEGPGSASPCSCLGESSLNLLKIQEALNSSACPPADQGT